MAKAKGGGERGVGRKGRKGVMRSSRSTALLGELGISKDQSSKWQNLGRVPQEEFDAALSDTTRMPTTNGILRETAAPG